MALLDLVHPGLDPERGLSIFQSALGEKDAHHVEDILAESDFDPHPALFTI
jgi:hypothetical protein